MSVLEKNNREEDHENDDTETNLMPSFAQMPSWTIVAVLSRIARILQNFAENRPDRETINDAIEIAEKAARSGLTDSNAVELADAAFKAGEHATHDGDHQAAISALCAAEAAKSVHLCADKASLLRSVEHVIQYVRQLGKPKCDIILWSDINQCAKLSFGQKDCDPAPPAILDYVHYQAVHEAGHAVAASGLGILFDTVKIIYNAGVEFIRNPIDEPDEVMTADRQKYLLGYAAGAAAEDVLLGKRQEWGCTQDRYNHKQCGGIDFNSDAVAVRKYGWFNNRILLKVASLLEQHRTLSDHRVKQVLNELGDS